MHSHINYIIYRNAEKANTQKTAPSCFILTLVSLKTHEIPSAHNSYHNSLGVNVPVC